MDSYNLLLKQVLDNPILKEEIDDIVKDQPEILNLVTLDWEERLENNLLYQEFCQNGSSMFRSQTNNSKHYHFEFIKNKSFNVLVAGECRFPKKYSNDDNKLGVTTINVKPLEEIAKAMYSDMESDFNLSNEFKFSFINCSPLGCNICRDYAKEFNEKGYSMKKMMQPCISSTRIYDGKNIVNRFICHIDCMFTENFIALLYIKLENRYNYNWDNVKMYRIGGKIQDIVAFQESKLYTPRSINTGHLIDVDVTLPDNSDNILKLPDYDTGEPSNKKIKTEEELLNNSEYEDKLLGIFKLPESSPEFDAAVPLNTKHEEDIEVEEKEEFLI